MSTFSLVMQPFTLAMKIGGNASDCLGLLSDEFDGQQTQTIAGISSYFHRQREWLHYQRKCRHSLPLALLSHSDGCAVHVHLSIADTIKPCPCQGVFPGCNTVIPPIFIANVNGCITRENVDIHFPWPGSIVEYNGDMLPGQGK
jgi:hypothetical protein